MNYTIKGILKEKFDTVEINDRFKKREYVIEVTNGDYTEVIKMQLTNDNCSKIDSYSVGDEFITNFNIRGRAWEKDGKTSYFTNLEAWKLEKNADQ